MSKQDMYDLHAAKNRIAQLEAALREIAQFTGYKQPTDSSAWSVFMMVPEDLRTASETACECIDLWTPETLYDSHGTPYQNNMARQDDSTEDDMLYVTYGDYKALADGLREIGRKYDVPPTDIQALLTKGE
jgi:hypothetical protein